MTGTGTKSICFKCKVNKWIVDYKEACASKISTTSVCLMCEHTTKTEKLERAVQEKDVMLKRMTTVVEKLGKRVEALERERMQNNVIDLGNSSGEGSCEPDIANGSSVRKTVGIIENAVRENMDNIADNGRAIVELRNDMVKVMREPGFQRANGRKVVKHSKKEKENKIELSNRYTALLQEEETNLIGDSMVKDQGDHFINKNKQRRKLKSFPGAKVKKVTEEVKRLEERNSRYVIVHAGSNDLYLKNKQISHSEAVVEELETLTDCLSVKTKRGIMIGLLPRMHSNHFELSKVIGVNERMKKYCQQKGVEFLDIWNVFIGKRHFFKNDGIHLSTLGNIKLGEILSKKCESFSSGRGSAPKQTFPLGQERTEDEIENIENTETSEIENAETSEIENAGTSSFLGFP